jgi:alpha-methylacyl-CoA racemase
MALSIDQYLATGEVAGPRQTLLTGRYACYDLYRCRDDKWLSVGAIEPRFFANLCRALGLEEHAAHQMDDNRQDGIREAFKAVFLTKDRDEWVRELAPNDTCVAPVHTIPELVEEPHWRRRGVFMQAEHPEHGRFDQLAPVLAGGVRKQPLHRVRPADETDSDEVFGGLGFAADEIEKLRADGAVE